MASTNARNMDLQVSDLLLSSRLFFAETYVVRMQQLLWVEEADYQGENSCQEGCQKVVDLSMTMRQMIVL